MRWLLVALLLLPGLAWAQPDIDLGPPVAGVWAVKASWPPEPDTAKVCFKLESTGEELGCTAGPPVPDVDSPTGNSISSTVTIGVPVTPAELCVRAYSLDAIGNQSADSNNCAIADFLPSGAPEML